MATAEFDLVIRGGTVIDGSGRPGFAGDVAISGDRIAAVGRVEGRGDEEIDADGLVVTPGFIDGHTHMDAQVLWDPLGSSSCYHGITTVAMGHCGFTLAPVTPDGHELVVRNLVRAEGIPAEALALGVDWSWESFPEYLDTIDRLPKGINYAANIGHSALRTYVMGERAFEEEATEDDLVMMERVVGEAIRAGAVGFTTSRGIHETSDGRPVASRIATWEEVTRICKAMGQAGGGIFQLALGADPYSSDPEVRERFRGALTAIAFIEGVTVAFGNSRFGSVSDSGDFAETVLNATRANGGRMFAMTNCRGISNLWSFEAHLPFDDLPTWKGVRAEPLERQRALLSDPAVRAKLVAEASDVHNVGYDLIEVLDNPLPPNPSLASIAAARGMEPVEAMIEIALERDFDVVFFCPNRRSDEKALAAVMRNPNCLMTFSDTGAHVAEVCDASIQTYLLAHWVRQRQEFTLEEGVRLITGAPAAAWGFSDRGHLAEGYVADLNVFDPATISPALPTIEHDLPGGEARYVQKATGITATLVSGDVTLRDGEPTGKLSGRLLRGPFQRRED